MRGGFGGVHVALFFVSGHVGSFDGCDFLVAFEPEVDRSEPEREDEQKKKYLASRVRVVLCHGYDS